MNDDKTSSTHCNIENIADEGERECQNVADLVNLMDNDYTEEPPLSVTLRVIGMFSERSIPQHSPSHR